MTDSERRVRTHHLSWMLADLHHLRAYAHRAGLRWQLSLLASDRVRLVDTTDPECIYDVVVTLAEAVDLFEDLTGIAALAVRA